MIVSYFVAPLTCPNCGKVSPEDTSTNMQTTMVPEFKINLLHIGDRLNIGIEEIEDSYLKIKDPGLNSSIVILETWNCPYDSTENWAKITIEEWTIQEIIAVELSEVVLDQAHFISDWIVEWFKGKTSFSLISDDLSNNLANILKDRLSS